MKSTLRLTRAPLVQTTTFVVIALLVLIPGAASAATSVSQFGVTWTFNRDYPAGQFANGDWWVLGPVTITDITPRSTTKDGVTRHGSMINPIPTVLTFGGQGWDSRMDTHPSGGVGYNASLNVARSFPLVVPNGSSLLSAVSFDPDRPANVNEHYPFVKTVAILTVLANVPSAGAFRPPYVGTNKAIDPKWNISNIDYSRLNIVAPLSTTPALATVLQYAVEPQIEIILGWPGRYMHPADNYLPSRFPGGNPTYGQAIANTYGAMLLSVNMNYSNAQKAPIVYRLIQMGIDIYGAAINVTGSLANGVIWAHGGGHNQGRKVPMMFAGVMLNDPQILARANHGEHKIFQEDSQYFYVSAQDVASKHRACCDRAVEDYTAADIGLPEWGVDHIPQPEEDNRLWSASYRNIVGSSTIPHVLTAKLMGLKALWNHPALFDYFEQRFYPNEKNNAGSVNGIEGYVRDLWEAYQHGPPAPVRPSPPQKLRLVR